MSDNIVGLAAVIMIFGIPMAAMYTFYRVRKLRTDERIAALARGVDVPMQPDLPEGARSRRFGILLTAGAIGYMATFALIARVEPNAWMAAAFGIIPLALGLGFFVDSALIRKDLHAQLVRIGPRSPARLAFRAMVCALWNGSKYFSLIAGMQSCVIRSHLPLWRQFVLSVSA